jgi:hypothetical protein
MKVVAFLAIGAAYLACAYPVGDCQYGDGCLTESIRRACGGSFVDSRMQGIEERCTEGSKCIENYRSNGTVYAACAIGDIDPKCERDEDIEHCDGNTWVRCKGRYREEAVDCGNAICSELHPRAACVRSLDPDPRCDGDAGPFTRQTTFCEGDVLFGCFGELSELRTSCAAHGEFCRVIAGQAACRLQAEPDPRCADTKRPFDMYCDGDTAVRCTLGWRDLTLDCALEGKRCVQKQNLKTNVDSVTCE